MSVLDQLIKCAGRWVGRNVLQDPHAGIADESPATATITQVLGGRFVRLDYTWAYKGQPQQGSLLIGHDASAGIVTGHWIDSWHMGNKLMACEGPVDASGTISVRGSYTAPPGPDWGWRMIVTSAPERLSLVMYNIFPEGQEELAVEAGYSRE